MIDHGFGVMLGPFDSVLAPVARIWRNHPDIRKWCRQSDLISDRDQADWFERQSKDPTIKMYGIAADESPVGVCGLTSIDLINRRAEFSVYVNRNDWGRGFGRKALSTLLTHGFNSLGLNSIWGESFDGNPAMKLFEDLGFKKEGVRRQFYFRNGSYIDAHLFSILATEWKEKCSSRS